MLQVVMLISVFWLRAMVVTVNVKPPNAQVPASHSRDVPLPRLTRPRPIPTANHAEELRT